MGKQFGNLTKIWGINYYTLSPYELKPFKGLIYPELYHTMRRLAENSPYIVLSFVCLVGAISYLKAESAARKRKKPSAYDCEF